MVYNSIILRLEGHTLKGLVSYKSQKFMVRINRAICVIHLKYIKYGYFIIIVRINLLITFYAQK